MECAYVHMNVYIFVCEHVSAHVFVSICACLREVPNCIIIIVLVEFLPVVRITCDINDLVDSMWGSSHVEEEQTCLNVCFKL